MSRPAFPPEGPRLSLAERIDRPGPPLGLPPDLMEYRAMRIRCDWRPALRSPWRIAVSSLAYGPCGRADSASFPTGRILLGPDSVQQLVVDRTAGGQTTTSPAPRPSPPPIPRRRRRLRPAWSSPGATASTIVTVRLEGGEGHGAGHGSRLRGPPPINFANQVVPIFTKLGCNAGGCHGKASGQNGFRLSLLGFEPTLDYETLVKEGRGRRLFPAAPERACCS